MKVWQGQRSDWSGSLVHSTTTALPAVVVRLLSMSLVYDVVGHSLTDPSPLFPQQTQKQEVKCFWCKQREVTGVDCSLSPPPVPEEHHTHSLSVCVSVCVSVWDTDLMIEVTGTVRKAFLSDWDNLCAVQIIKGLFVYFFFSDGVCDGHSAVMLTHTLRLKL